jgi:hypothetical protein
MRSRGRAKRLAFVSLGLALLVALSAACSSGAGAKSSAAGTSASSTGGGAPTGGSGGGQAAGTGGAGGGSCAPEDMAFDDVVLGTGPGQVDYAGTGWMVGPDPLKYGGSDHFSSTAGDTATFRFAGTQVRVYGTLDSHHGIAAISIDGTPVGMADFYSPVRLYTQVVFTSAVLPAGIHALEIQVTGQKDPASTAAVVALDRFDDSPSCDLPSLDGGTPDDGPDAGDAGNPFVVAQGTSLVLEGKPYRFFGFNRYDLAGSAQVPSCSLDGNAQSYPKTLDATLNGMQLLGGTVARFWAFQQYAGASGKDFSYFDQVVAAAKTHGIRLIFTLENQWHACTQPSADKTAAWYQGGYMNPYGSYALSYPAYVTNLVKHFATEPQILMWQLMNEAECTDATALQTFAKSMATLIKGLDSNHLVNVGTLACGQNGVTGANYSLLHADPHIDLLEAHDYGNETQAVSACITADAMAAQALMKPFFIGEAGISTKQFTAAQRATDMDAKIKGAASKGFAGWMMWSYGGPGDQFGVYAPGDNDPLVSILQADATLF